MTKTLYIETTGHQRRYALVHQDTVIAFYSENLHMPDLTDNIYFGIVRDIKKAMQACFVDIGLKDKAFLRLKAKQHVYAGEKVLVQIKQNARQGKGAQLTQSISMTSRHLVLHPTQSRKKISRNIHGHADKTRLSAWLNKQVKGIGITLRSNAVNASDTQLSHEFDWLINQYRQINKQYEQKSGLCYRAAPNWLAQFDFQQIDSIITDNENSRQEIQNTINDSYWSGRIPAISLCQAALPLFTYIGIDKQIRALYEPMINLPGGGNIIIEKTSAMTTIDVNMASDSSANTFADSALSINIQAAQSIAEQLRLRNMGGIIMLDFINLPDKAMQKTLLSTLHEALKKDTAIRHISQLSYGGVIEIIRQQRHKGIMSAEFTHCNHCQYGWHLHASHRAYELLRDIKKYTQQYQVSSLKIQANKDIIDYLHQHETSTLNQYQQQLNVTINLENDTQLGAIGYHISSQ